MINGDEHMVVKEDRKSGKYQQHGCTMDGGKQNDPKPETPSDEVQGKYTCDHRTKRAIESHFRSPQNSQLLR